MHRAVFIKIAMVVREIFRILLVIDICVPLIFIILYMVKPTGTLPLFTVLGSFAWAIHRFLWFKLYQSLIFVLEDKKRKSVDELFKSNEKFKKIGQYLLLSAFIDYAILIIEANRIKQGANLKGLAGALYGRFDFLSSVVEGIDSNHELISRTLDFLLPATWGLPSVLIALAIFTWSDQNNKKFV